MKLDITINKLAIPIVNTSVTLLLSLYNIFSNKNDNIKYSTYDHIEYGKTFKIKRYSIIILIINIKRLDFNPFTNIINTAKYIASGI